MPEFFPFARSPRPGFRLHKLEAFNWGTFDSARGSVYSVRPQGQNALLVGQNGSGKSTLVDGLLTLLVRPVVRNYNVAAGAQKKERDERTYIKGAYGRTSREEDNRGEIEYLRPDGKHYSALLATFVNEDSEKSLSVAQVLYLTTDGRVEKYYCLAPGERSLAADCSGFPTLERLGKQLEERGWRTTKTYKDFHHWFSKATGVKPKAMDMFNQTVAVKDIQSLTDFIRKHMLEANPWNEKVESVLSHFTALSDAHQSLVRVRRQAELLEPIARRAVRYRQQAEQLDQTQRLIDAADAYFETQIVELFAPYADALDSKRREADEQELRLLGEIAASREETRRLSNEIEAAGGERLRQIPLLIEQRKIQARNAREAQQRYVADVERAELGPIPAGVEEFAALRARLPQLLADLTADAAGVQTLRDEAVVARGDVARSLQNDRQEWEALGARTGNLPRSLAEMRDEICSSLRLSERELPFAAELIRVDQQNRDWEASIEMVLRPLALSLLTPEKHYRVVSAHVDRTRMVDQRGQGQRLVYLRVGTHPNASPGSPAPHSLLNKLELRAGHPLLPWLRGELADRYDYQCCETIDEFSSARGLAVTQQRHVKMGRVRHEKDDRSRSADPRFFVLGWDNREKRRRLAEEIVRQEKDLADADARIDDLDRRAARLQQRRGAMSQLQSFAEFSDIDYRRHDRETAALMREKEELENKNDVVRTLRSRLAEAEKTLNQLESDRADVIRASGALSEQACQARKLVANAQRTLTALQAAPAWRDHAAAFGLLAESLADVGLSVDNLQNCRVEFNKRQNIQVQKLRKAVEPLREKLCAAMNQFLRAFDDQRSDLDARIEYLDKFLEVRTHIQREDLPRHEQRFKERLNEKVTQEIGLLNGALQTERGEIESKIEQLNLSLRQLEYRPGTHMRLDARIVRDREILEFRNGLAECLSGAFEGSLESDEARYRQIEKLVNRLREEERWRDKVTDVRRWFDFAAIEIDDQTGEQRAYYEDSTGQSGGEKAKLAFTILVAAIAYQYDIDPERPTSDRFHFVVVDEMFSKVDDRYAEYALDLFKKFGLQLLIVAPLDAKARVTEPYVGYYAHVVKDARTHKSEILSMTAAEFAEAVVGVAAGAKGVHSVHRPPPLHLALPVSRRPK